MQDDDFEELTKFKVNQDLFRILRFVEDLIDKDQKKILSENPKAQVDLITKIFVNHDGLFKRSEIENRFKQLMRRLNVYDEKSDLYQIGKSPILVKVFKTHERFRDDQLWPRLLDKMCTVFQK